MSLIEVRNVTFAYNESHNAVDNVSFDIRKGDYVTVIGHNGSGKSTLAKLIAGLLPLKEGEILIDGVKVDEEHISQIREKLGIVFQNPDNQFIGSTVRDDIAFGLENHCVPREEMDDIINTFAERVRMTKYLDHEPTRLSGGQKQRVAIAGVLAMHPDVIVFDEATSMLDPQGKEEIKKLIADLHRDRGLTILSITHDIEEVTASDYVVAMNRGKVALCGTPEEFFKDADKLKSINIALPFAMQFEEELRRCGVRLNRQITMEGLVEELCRLHSNM